MGWGSASDSKQHVLGVKHRSSFASKFAPLWTRKRVFARWPLEVSKLPEESMSAVAPLTTEIRKIEQNCSSASDSKQHV
jgi:hypothetical protein